MRKRWLIILSVASVALVISGCLLLGFAGASALNRALHPTYPATKVCQPGSGASAAAAQAGQPVVLAVVHAYRYQELAGGYRGQYTPIGPQTNIICELRPQDGSLAQRLDIGLGGDQFYKLTQVGDTYYLDGAMASGSAILCAVNSQSGATRWCYTNPANESSEAFSYVISADGRQVYVRTHETVYGLDAVSGQQQWRIAYATPQYVTPVLAATPTVVATVGVTISASGVTPTQASVVGLSPTSGAVLWRRPLTVATPSYTQLVTDGAAFYVENDDLNITHPAGILAAVGAGDGAVRWQVPLHCSGVSFPLTTSDGRVYYDDGGCNTDASQLPWTFFALRASDGTPAWSLRGDSTETGILAANGGTLYIIGAFGVNASVAATAFYALRAADGSTLWKVPLINAQRLQYIALAFRQLTFVDGVICHVQYEATITELSGVAIDGYSASSGALVWRAGDTISQSLADTPATPSVMHKLWPVPFASVTAEAAGVA